MLAAIAQLDVCVVTACSDRVASLTRASWFGEPEAAVAADVDGDGHLDIAPGMAIEPAACRKCALPIFLGQVHCLRRGPCL